MKVVKKVSTGEVVYQQSPDFETGLGIKNAIALYGGTESDYVEVEA